MGGCSGQNPPTDLSYPKMEDQAATLAHAKQVRATQSSSRRAGQTRLPRLLTPKQHHQHARATAAVIVARGRGSNSWEGHIVAEQRANSYAYSMFASLCPFAVFAWIVIVCEAYW